MRACRLTAWLLVLAAWRPHSPVGAFVADRFLYRFRIIAARGSAADSQSRTPLRARESPHGSYDGLTIGTYRHDGVALTYLHKAAAPGREMDRPVVLVHPVGIGLSSWFWERVLVAYDDNPPLYAPDLIGCGLNHGADAWDPQEKGLFFPLSWVEGVETLIETVIAPRGRGGCLVVAQGGLAPVGIMLAHRNPQRVATLLLTSPPAYADVATAIPERELQRNYEFLRSPFLGGWAFAVLESRAVIQFFSNLFLFQGSCDERWLDAAREEVRPEARTPVQAFNAGLLQHRSYARELGELTQTVAVASGKGDRRAAERRPYESALKECTLKTIEGGCNVLPWETPVAVVALMKELGY